MLLRTMLVGGGKMDGMERVNGRAGNAFMQFQINNEWGQKRHLGDMDQ